MPWWDFYKLFNYSFELDPLEKKSRSQEITGAAVTQPGAMPDIRQDGSFWGGGRGLVALHDSHEFLDLSSVTTRTSRYKEYERLRNVSEIEQAMTIYADESCVAGSTLVPTPYYGVKTIKWLAENVEEEFLVYCWDFEKKDYTLGWAFNPRKVDTAKTIRIKLDNGSKLIATPDHRVLMLDGTWKAAGEVEFGDELMPFYRLKPNRFHTNFTTKQFPRIFTFTDGWKHERQFINEWRTGRKDGHQIENVYKTMRMLSEGLTIEETVKFVGHHWDTLKAWMRKEGFCLNELRNLGKNDKKRRVIGIFEHEDIDVYDLSVKKHENFCTDSYVVHNCQLGDNNHMFSIDVEDNEIRKELEFVLFNRKMLNLDRKLWKWSKDLYVWGDLFLEVVINPENPKDGILKLAELPAESVYRIETTKGRLIEFQQAKDGPDYQSLTRAPVTQATEADLQQSTALRFDPHQIIHLRVGEDRKHFYPYGVSLVEAARGPAHQLRLMEDAMVVYRLVRAPERRVFYIDVGQLPPFKAEAFVERMKDQFRKKKVASGKGGTGANAVEERWSPQSADEDYWIPVRPNANTRVDTLPGAQNLGEIDDAVYFRNKLLIALGLPPNYFNSDDPNATRITLSVQNIRFARTIERLQSSIVDGLYEICERHLHLRGFPEDAYSDLEIKMTPPSEWRELSRQELVNGRIANLTALKGSMFWSDYDLNIDIMKIPEEEAEQKVARMKAQKYDDLKLQVLASNPNLFGIGTPGDEGQPEMGIEAGGPNPMLGDQGQPGEMPPPEGGDMDAGGIGPEAGGADMDTGGIGPEAGGTTPAKQNIRALPKPHPEDIKKYDLEIEDYDSEQDVEEIDYSELG